ncbi:MAG: heparan-alpha-glucosaminide N-acetyltransferase domain-containing protein [Candidatus Kapabacteria bacterium]|nr:heparan-alpha-glucosaminide N-acetyltransferase domain-containing protein [Candidatus Kapabacteria bacterium]
MAVTEKKQRLIFIDVLRGIAVIWMIETHVVDIMLNRGYKVGWFYNQLNISNGFVAVSFLFCAGAGFWLASMRKGDDYRNFRLPLWIYIRRLLLILAVGFWLHTPILSLSRLINLAYAPLNPADPTFPYRTFYGMIECDVLQAIIYSSFISLFLMMIIKNMKILRWVFLVLSVAVFALAPIIWNINFMDKCNPFIGALFTGRIPGTQVMISKFPLFPWSGYFFGGVALTAFFMAAENKRRFAWIVFIITFIAPHVIFWVKDLPFVYPGNQNWWWNSPGHSLFRISVSSCVFAFLYLTENYYRNWFISKPLQLSGQESLFLYTSHILLVYNIIPGDWFRQFYQLKGSLDWLGTLIAFIVITVLCYYVSKLWHILKDRDMFWARVVINAVLLFFIVKLVFTP